MTTGTETSTTQVYRVFIRATPETIWNAITTVAPARALVAICWSGPVGPMPCNTSSRQVDSSSQPYQEDYHRAAEPQATCFGHHEKIDVTIFDTVGTLTPATAATSRRVAGDISLSLYSYSTGLQVDDATKATTAPDRRAPSAASSRAHWSHDP